MDAHAGKGRVHSFSLIGRDRVNPVAAGFGPAGRFHLLEREAAAAIRFRSGAVLPELSAGRQESSFGLGARMVRPG
ncbi:hypothetical protein [Rhodovulum sp.]|uniref:hypothetical protein n=1 Tax=Rhodovulum sp. TaxID=34009 RepID=UPI0017A71B11|nr:hypothetical protein [Rhodovulum sp.]HDR27424.1 hypothetical protein [Rhodovulum sp.]